jgi:hypothetical protein
VKIRTLSDSCQRDRVTAITARWCIPMTTHQDDNLTDSNDDKDEDFTRVLNLFAGSNHDGKHPQLLSAKQRAAMKQRNEWMHNDKIKKLLIFGDARLPLWSMQVFKGEGRKVVQMRKDMTKVYLARRIVFARRLMRTDGESNPAQWLGSSLDIGLLLGVCGRALVGAFWRSWRPRAWRDEAWVEWREVLMIPSLAWQM